MISYIKININYTELTATDETNQSQLGDKSRKDGKARRISIRSGDRTRTKKERHILNSRKETLRNNISKNSELTINAKITFPDATAFFRTCKPLIGSV